MPSKRQNKRLFGVKDLMKHLKLIALVLLLATLLVGCDSASSTEETGAPANTTQQEAPDTEPADTENTPPAEEPEFITLFGKDTSKDYTVISGIHNAEDIVNLFKNKFYQKTNKSLNIKSTSTDESDTEILIGYAYNREESVEAYGMIASTEYEIRFVDKKLTISSYTSSGLELALDYLVANIETNDDGEFGLMSDFTYKAKSVRLDYDVPKVQTKKGYVLDGYVSNSQFQLAYKNVTTEEVANYGELLKSEGYTQHASNTIGNNKFATYYKDDVQVHTMFYPILKDFRVVFGKLGYLPDTSEPQYTRTNDVSLMQNVRAGKTNGMSYTVKLADGSFLIIDGGQRSTADTNSLLSFLQTNKPASDAKPRVIWMITHAHADHLQLANDFLEKYKNEIELEMVCYNFPDTSVIVDDGAGLTPYIKTFRSLTKNTTTFIFHSGQKLYLPGVEIEFLATQEDYWPNEFTNENLTSNVWRMKFEDGRTLLIVGDLENTGSDRLTDVYGSLLESDIFQVNHHGYSGYTAHLINFVDPKICLWSTTQAVFEDYNGITGSANNKVLRQQLKTTNWTRSDGTSGSRTHYHGEQEFTITFSPAD